MQLSELPQGALPLEPLPSETLPAYPPVIQQARENMDKFTNCVVLTRVGGFYELYFEHAEEVGPLLNLKVSPKKAGAGTISMAGFPFFQLDRMLRILVQDLHRYVALIEEYPNSTRGKTGGLMFDRKITRIVTPGTLIDEKFLDGYENNFLLALALSSPARKSRAKTEPPPQSIGLAWLDLSTGDFFTQESNMANLSGDIARIWPREVLVNDKYKGDSQNPIVRRLEEDKLFITYYPQPEIPKRSIDNWEMMLEAPVSREEKSKFSKLEVQAGTILLNYVKEQLPGLSVKLQPPIKRFAQDIMGIDSNSMRSLEIKQTIRDGISIGSLLHTIKCTVTKSGSRLLSQWLSAPITSLPAIEDRLDIVDFFYHNGPLREDIVALLRKTQDSQRLAQKFSIGKGTPDDLISLARTIEITRNILIRLKSEAQLGKVPSLHKVLSKIDIPMDLAQTITSSIDEDGLILQQKIQEFETAELVALAEASLGSDDETLEPRTITKPKTIDRDTDTSGYFESKSGILRPQPCASPALLKLHKRLDKQFEDKQKLTETLRVDLGASSLLLKWSPSQGHFCHVKGKDSKTTLEKVPDSSSIGMSRSTRSFQHPDWTALGIKIDQTRIQIRTEEDIILRKLRDEVIQRIATLRRNGFILDQLDIATSFAHLAHEKNYIRPILNQGTNHKVIGGRHPMVEDGLWEQGRSFTANDCLVGEVERLWLITGPNMAGKSTFLRQNALISILAQIGCFVPADYAEIGIVDQVFSRVGSADNLFRNQSTFMVEMLETANILRSATPRSFVIVDEIGRGTTPIEGSVIAFACLHHLYTVNKSRTLFATHFHNVAAWATRSYKKIGYYCTDVQEDENGGFTYIHKLRKGVNRQPHALKVAMLAGIPEKTIRMAEEHLRNIQEAAL
ncbi:muts domain V [Kalaharituber pfeilii]|nr:muts domain V [Kalaharituber pfeilii]